MTKRHTSPKRTAELDAIVVKGAREHNLKHIDIELPKKRLIVFTGVSGSGKSSLAFDTIFAEGQRRYVESLSAYARQFIGQLARRAEPFTRVLLQALQADRLQVARHAAVQLPRAGRLLVEQLMDQHLDVAAERLLAGRE